jgi:hypothetical protein
MLTCSALLLAACGGSSGNGSSNSALSVSTVTVGGTVSLSNLGGSSLSTQSVDPENYMLWVQNRYTKRVYSADLDENGDFELPIGVTGSQNLGNNFIFCLIKKDPLTFAGTIMKSVSGNYSTGVEIDQNVSNFNINFDVGNYSAIMSSPPSAVEFNPSINTRVSSDRPIGADNAGKGEDSETTDLNAINTIDKDEDGVPDIFDAMNNGQDLDNTDGANKVETAVFSDTLESVTMFMNLKVDEERESTYTVTDSATVVLEVVPVDASDIDTIEVDLLHTSFQTAVFDRVPGGYTALESGHVENTTWLQSGQRKLIKMRNDGNSNIVWQVIVKPGNNNFNPGSLARIKVTKTDSSVEYYFTSINFKFQSIVDHTTTSYLSGDGSRSNPYVIPTTGNLDLAWNAPQDESGNDLTDLEYSVEFFFYDNATPENQIGDRAVQTLGDDVYSGTIPAATLDAYESSTPSPSMVQIDITCRYEYGDNSANKIYVKRSNWP